jgi:GT2 family glycosyltransferase
MEEGKAMKVGKRGLKMSSGKIYHFKSKAGRNRFEHVAQAYKHGWRPTRKGR